MSSSPIDPATLAELRQAYQQKTVGVRLSEKAAQGKGSRQALGSGMNNTRYHRFRLERDAPTQEQYGSIVVGIPIGVGDFDKGGLRRLKRALFGGAFLFPTESRSPCCNTRSIPIGGGTQA